MVEKILDVFSTKNNYDIALMTTFNFDISFFESAILNRLYENDVKKVSLFVDSYELNKALSQTERTSIGKKYVVNPIEMNEAFHPKIILLLGQVSAKLVIASANITVSGYLKNNEIFNVFDYDDKHPQNLNVINKAIDFFEQLNKRSFNQDAALFDEIKDFVYYDRTCNNEELYLLHNLNNSILSQVSEKVHDVTSIDVAVPYYDNYAVALESLHSNYPEAKINLYLQNKKCKFPLSHKDDHFINSIYAFDKCNDSTNFYHGKVFRFTTFNDVYFLYGSANCTKSALTKSASDSGNVECCILESGSSKEFDSFFENFNIIPDSINLQCDLLTFENEINSNFFFRYGSLGNELILNIGYLRKIEEIEVFYNEIKLNFEYINNNLVVSIPLEIILLEDLITITIKTLDKTERIKCWYTDIATINFNRDKTSELAFYSASLYNDDDEKYVEDVKTILEAMSLSIDDAIKEKLLIDKINGTKETVEADEYDDDEGIISYVIPEAFEIAQYRKYEHIDKHFKIPCFKYFNEEYNRHCSNKAHKTTASTWSQTQIKERRPSSSEIKFKRFVKARVRQMLEQKYIEYVSLEHYIFCVNTILSVFNKYSLKENVNDMFECEYLIETKTSFIEAMLNKGMPENASEEIKNTFLIIVCQMMLESYKQVRSCDMDNYKVEHWHKKILKELESQFQFRKIMCEYICTALDRINEFAFLYHSYQEAIDVMEESFGYATNETLEKIIRSDYGATAKIYIEEDQTLIFAQTSSIKDFFITKERTLLELKKAYNNNTIGRYLKIEIENIAPIPENSKYAYMVCDEIDLRASARVHKIIRKDGTVDKPVRTKI